MFGTMVGSVILVVLIVLVLWVVASCIRVVPEAQAMVVERFGGYLTTWNKGIHLKMPFVDRVAKRVTLKEQVVDFAPQPVITKDNVTMQIDTVVFYQITDPKLFAYGVENPILAIENLTATTLRNIIGDMELDETLTSREVINTKMRANLDQATDPWGIKVGRVELKNIIPPDQIVDAMEKQMKAERERREAILIAEGEKKSSILRAAGKKESAILEAEAEKEAAKEAGADQAVLALKSLEVWPSVANGKATKIIIPSELQNVAGLIKSVAEVAKDSDIAQADPVLAGNGQQEEEDEVF